MAALAIGVAGLLVGIVGIWMMERGFRRMIERERLIETNRRAIEALKKKQAHERLLLGDELFIVRSAKEINDALSNQKPKSRFAWIMARQMSRVPTAVPSWALGLMNQEDAQRYSWEWSAHLYQLIEDGEVQQARHDRRRFVIAALTLAVVLRVRRALGRAR